MNQKFKFSETEIAGLFKIDAFNAEDIRGCLTKDFSKEVFQASGISYELSEVFYTTSHKGVIRGLHFQRVRQMPKLIRCIKGHVYDVVVDLRLNSPTFKSWIGFDLIDKEYTEILIPGGCAHGYLVLEDSIVSYKCAEKFYSEYDSGIKWDDPDIGVNWQLEKIGGGQNLIVAEKDKNLQSFAEFIQCYKGLQ